MSRSRKHSKGPGYEYWAARPFSMSSPGRVAKTLTHRHERRERKRLAWLALHGEERDSRWPKTA